MIESSITIERCSADAVGYLTAFLASHYQSNHVLVRSRRLLDWQHRDDSTGRYNFVVARLRTETQLLGVLGYIPTHRFDPALYGRGTLWLALWKVRDDCQYAGLGLRMLQYLRSIEPHTAIGVVGIGNPAHAPMYRALGFFSGELRQFYLLNDTVGQFSLADVDRRDAAFEGEHGGGSLELLNEQTMFTATKGLHLGDDDAVVPEKTVQYFYSRFLQHPFYAYRVYLVRVNDAAAGLLAIRVATHRDARALRIVDYAGDTSAIAQVGPALRDLLIELGAEYADVWTHGLPDIQLRRAGFRLVERDKYPVIPSYFEPFERRNCRLDFAFKGPPERTAVIFKADGDQDRPNVVLDGE